MDEKIFIGVAWPYANGSLHLGHIAGCYLPADIFARYNRLQGRKILMVSGSDEHGTPITITAEKENVTPQAIVDRYHAEHVENMKQLGISFDLFTRTTTTNHETTVQEIFLDLYQKKFIHRKSIDALYCPTCARFLPDRYVEGTCPHCKKEGARGDQCDNCGKLLDTFELLNVKCKVCGGIPVKQKTEHLFFALSAFETKLMQWLKKKQYWKANVLKFTNNWLQNGLHDRAITRDISWGIKVPVFGFENKRIYVWFDAVIGYLSASKEWAKHQKTPMAWQDWWKNPAAKHYYFLAKDNIPFHSIIWPSILMGYDETLNLPYDIPANEYLTLKGEQFSKSRGVGIWVPDILKRFDADVVRYYLSINMPENKDADWTWNDFVSKNNDELLGTYGNFIHRVITFTSKNFGVIPEAAALRETDRQALQKIQETHSEVGDALEQCSFKKGLRAVMNLAQYGNVYFDHNQPWVLIKTDQERCKTVLHISIKIVQALAVCMAPYLPFSSNQIWKMLGYTGPIQHWGDALLDVPNGTALETPTPLFKKLELTDIVTNPDPFSKLDLRVAKILDVSDHPQADKLYIMQVDLGPLGKRAIVAGMKPYYQKQEITGKSIVMVINLKPAVIRGVESRGMLLAATDASNVVSLLDPKDSSPGAEVGVEGIAREPAPVLDFEAFKLAPMTVDAAGNVVYNGKPLRIKETIIMTDRKVQEGAKVS
ncbi:MAG: methionine--tRNA ligase [Candidatus Thermoplasmatota archaeon]|nr:methionine--tRNA ligase [Candidatus Thermoplasmatota archaeon]